jgi:hypothetical protein
MMEAARIPEMLVNFNQITRRFNPEDSHFRTHRRENLKSYKTFFYAQMSTNLCWLKIIMGKLLTVKMKVREVQWVPEPQGTHVVPPPPNGGGEPVFFRFGVPAGGATPWVPGGSGTHWTSLTFILTVNNFPMIIYNQHKLVLIWA